MPKHRRVCYYKTAAGVEVDFIIETARRRPNLPPVVVAIEIKPAKKWDRAWNKPMWNLAGSSGVKVNRMIGVYCGKRTYRFDNIEVLPVAEFLKAFFSGEVF